jgi:hypothetical protein
MKLFNIFGTWRQSAKSFMAKSKIFRASLHRQRYGCYHFLQSSYVIVVLCVFTDCHFVVAAQADVVISSCG